MLKRQSELRYSTVVFENVVDGIMRATMYFLSTLAFFAIGLFVPTLSAPAATTTSLPVNSYYIWILDTKAFGDNPTLLAGAVSQIDKDEGEVVFGHFVIPPQKFDAFRKTMDSSTVTPFKRVSIDKFPPKTLLTLVVKQSALYSEALPYLLKSLKPEEVAEDLPKDLLKTLKEEDKKKIPADVFEKFEKLYKK